LLRGAAGGGGGGAPRGGQGGAMGGGPTAEPRPAPGSPKPEPRAQEPAFLMKSAAWTCDEQLRMARPDTLSPETPRAGQARTVPM
jgi:hypothetical protein